MLLESTLLVLNVLLCAVIVYSILHPKLFERTVRDQLAKVYERWKRYRRVHPKNPDACALCRGEQEPMEQLRQPVLSEDATGNFCAGIRKPFTAWKGSL